MRGRRQLQALAGEQFRLPDGGGRAGHLEEDLEDPVPRAARPASAISLVVGGIVIMNIMLDGGERADPRDRHPEGARRPAPRHPGAVRRRVRHPLASAGAMLGIAFGLALAFVVKALTPLPAAVAPWSIGRGRRARRRRRHRGRGVPGEPRLPARPHRRAEGRVTPARPITVAAPDGRRRGDRARLAPRPTRSARRSRSSAWRSA